MKRYLLYVAAVFLLETLLLALLQDRPLLTNYMKQQDRLLTDAFLAAWPLGLIALLFRRKRETAAPKAKSGKPKPAKRKKKSNSAASHS